MRRSTSSTFKALGLITLASTLWSCSATSPTSEVEIQLPNWQALREADLARQSKLSTLSTTASSLEMVVITVSGAPACAVNPKDGKPNSYTWESHDGGEPKSSVTFTIPYNTGCFVQVMAMYGGEGLAIYYDGKPALLTKEATLTLNPTNQTSSANVTEGHVSGRFVDANGNGPTGRFLYQFQPSVGPRMRVHHGEIFAGWASVFALNIPSLVYTWDADKNFADVDVLKDIYNTSSKLKNATYPQRSLSVFVPKSFEERHEDSTTAYVLRAASRQVVGFFGEGAGNKKVCYLHGTAPVAVESLYLSNSNATPVMFTGTTASANSSSVEYGGSPNASDCTGGLWVDYMVADPSRARDSMVMFEGPFAWPGPPATDMISITDGGVDLVNVAWKLLPGVASNLDGISVFFREWPSGGGSDDDIRENDTYKCSALESIGFSKVDVSRSTESTMLSTSVSPSNLQVVLCARKPGGYFASGTRNHGSFGSGNQMPMATQIKLTPLDLSEPTTSGREKMYTNGCYPMIVRALTADGKQGWVPSPSNITFTTNPADAANDLFYSDEFCLNTVGEHPKTMGLWPNTIVYLKMTRVGGLPADVDVTATTSGSLTSTGSLHAHFEMSAPSPDFLSILAPGEIKKYGCYPVYFQSRHQASSSVTHASVPVSFDLPVATGLDFYQGACAPGLEITTVDLGFQDPAHVNTRPLYFRYTGSAASLSLTPTSNAAGWTLQSKSVSVTEPGPAARLALQMPIQTNPEACETVQVSLTDDEGNITINDTGADLFFTTSGSHFYDVGDCSGSGTPVTSFAIADGDTMRTLYFQAQAVGTHALGVAASSGGLEGSSFDINVSAPQANHIEIAMPGESFDPATNTKSGNPFAVYRETPLTIQLYAMTPGGHLATNYNESNLAFLNLTGDVDTLDVLGFSGFAGGVATATVKFSSWSGNPMIGINAGGLGQLDPTMSTYATYIDRSSLQTYHTGSYASSGCAPVLFVLGDGINAAPIVATGGHTLDFTSSTDVSIHAINSCAGSPVAIPDGGSATLAYVSFGASPVLSIDIPDLSLTGLAPGLPADSGQSPQAATDFAIVGEIGFKVGVCQPFAVIPIDAYANGVAKGGSGGNVVFSTDGTGKFYDDGRCLTGESSSKTTYMSSGDSGKVFYFRAFADSGETISATDSTSALGTGDLYVTPSF